MNNDNIFGYFVANGNPEDDGKRVSYMLWFLEHFPANEFHQMSRILYEYVEFSGKLKIPLKLEYAEVFCKDYLRKFLINKKVKIEGTEDLNFDDASALENAVRITTEKVKDRIIWYEDNRDDYNLQDFIVSAKQFMHSQLDSRLTDVLSGTFDMKTETDDADKALSWAKVQLENIGSIYDEGCLEELDMTTTSGESGDDMEFVCNTGLEGVDADIDGIYTTQLGGLEAAPGTGKTRFSLGVWAYRAAVYFHKNVLFYSLEQNKKECEAMLIARHVYELFQIQIVDKLIARNNVPDEYKEQVEAARIDLFESGKYGKIHVVATDLYMETFIDKIKATDRLKGPFDLIIIDYMALITEQTSYGKPKGIGEIVSYCYRAFKKYVRQSNKAGIAVNQLNREGIAASEADKDITTEMAQGGLEVYRSTDFNLVISATKEMRLQKKRRISQPKARSSENAAPVIVDVRLGVCLFYQQAKKII